MQELKLTGATARRIYSKAPPEFKEVLEESFGKEFFSAKVEDRIWSVEDACRETGRDIDQVIPFPNPINQFQDSLNATAEWAVIAEAFNGSEIPNWRDPKQKKHIPWAKMDGSSGSGLSFYVADYVLSFAAVASRLTCRCPKRAKFMFETYKPLFEKMIIFHP